MKMKAPETVSGSSNFLEHDAKNEGWYLFTVVDAHEGQYKAGKDKLEMMDGFSFEVEVVGGPNDGKLFQLKFYDGKLTSKDQGLFALQKQFAALVATDVCNPTQLGTEFECDPTESIGALFVAKLALGNPGNDGKRYLDLSYSDIHHVDDPRAASVKLDDEQRARVAKIQAKFRHPGDYFAPLLKKKEASKSTEKAAKPNFDDL